MKRIIRTAFIYAICLYVIAYFVPALTFQSNLIVATKASIILALFDFGVKPILKILLLPLNILTFGFTRLFINIIGLYLIVIFVNELKISRYVFPGINWNGFMAPEREFSLIMTYLIVSIMINLCFSIIRWIIKK